MPQSLTGVAAGRLRDRDGEGLAEIGCFLEIGLLVLNDHGAAADHLLLLAGVQGFCPGGNLRWFKADIVDVDRAEGVNAIDILRGKPAGEFVSAFAVWATAGPAMKAARAPAAIKASMTGFISE